MSLAALNGLWSNWKMSMSVGGDLFVCLVIGLALPLALLDLARVLLHDRLPVQTDGLQLELRPLPWILTLLAGPALLFNRVCEGWRERCYSHADIAIGFVMTVGWAEIYGYLILQAIRHFGG